MIQRMDGQSRCEARSALASMTRHGQRGSMVPRTPLENTIRPAAGPSTGHPFGENPAGIPDHSNIIIETLGSPARPPRSAGSERALPRLVRDPDPARRCDPASPSSAPAAHPLELAETRSSGAVLKTSSAVSHARRATLMPKARSCSPRVAWASGLMTIGTPFWRARRQWIGVEVEPVGVGVDFDHRPRLGRGVDHRVEVDRVAVARQQQPARWGGRAW